MPLRHGLDRTAAAVVLTSGPIAQAAEVGQGSNRAHEYADEMTTTPEVKMKLTDLNPEWVRYDTRIETYFVVDGDYATWRKRGCPTKQVTGPREYKIQVGSFAEAQGVCFDCPKGCSHRCEVSFEDRGVQPSQGTHKENGDPVRWKATGNTFEDLTTTPSIQLIGGCAWHGFITGGIVT